MYHSWNSDVKFYTGIPNCKLFCSFHQFVSQFVKKRDGEDFKSISTKVNKKSLYPFSKFGIKSNPFKVVPM